MAGKCVVLAGHRARAPQLSAVTSSIDKPQSAGRRSFPKELPACHEHQYGMLAVRLFGAGTVGSVGLHLPLRTQAASNG
jgi:hypothetical protein